MCDSHRPLEGADSEPLDTDQLQQDGAQEPWYEGKEYPEPVSPTERMIQEWLPEATRRPVWPDRAVYGGWDHPRNSEAS